MKYYLFFVFFLVSTFSFSQEIVWKGNIDTLKLPFNFPFVGHFPTGKYDSLFWILDFCEKKPAKIFLRSDNDSVPDGIGVYGISKTGDIIEIIKTVWFGGKCPNWNIPPNQELSGINISGCAKGYFIVKNILPSGNIIFLKGPEANPPNESWCGKNGGCGSFEIEIPSNLKRLVIHGISNPKFPTIWQLGIDSLIVKKENQDTLKIEKNTCNPDSVGLFVEKKIENGCEYVILTTIKLLPKSDIKITTENPTICTGEITILYPSTMVDSVFWSTKESASFIEVTGGNYTALFFKDGFCPVMDEIEILEKNCCEENIYVPNAFSPNGDGINDIFMIFFEKNCVSQIRSFKVFDRWGGNLYEKYNFPPNDLGYGWDGTARGIPLNPATFIWFAEVVFSDGQIKHYEGGIALIR